MCPSLRLLWTFPTMRSSPLVSLPEHGGFGAARVPPPFVLAWLPLSAGVFPVPPFPVCLSSRWREPRGQAGRKRMKNVLVCFFFGGVF